MSTQWRVGMSGATGLDYNALPVVMDNTNIPKNMRASVFNDLRTLEDSALDAMRKAKK